MVSGIVHRLIDDMNASMRGLERVNDATFTSRRFVRIIGIHQKYNEYGTVCSVKYSFDKLMLSFSLAEQ